MLTKLIRTTCQQQVRLVNTAAAANNFIPGKQGYSPDFSPPKPIQRTPKPKPSFVTKPNPLKPKPKPDQLTYKQQVTELRKVYIKELKEIEEQRKLEDEKRIKAEEAKLLIQEKAIQVKAEQLQSSFKKDELSIQNIEGQVSKVNPFTDPTLKADRKQKKFGNYIDQSHQKNQQSLETLLSLVTRPNSFVTESNISQVIDDCFNTSYVGRFGTSNPAQFLFQKNEQRLKELEQVLTRENNGYPNLEFIKELQDNKEEGVENWVKDMKEEKDKKQEDELEK